MRKLFISFSLLFLNVGIKAQSSFIDYNLQEYARKTLVAGIKEWGDDISQAGLCIMKSSGEVIVDINIGKFRGKVKDIPGGNGEGLPCAISRAVLYLSLMDVFTPDYIVNIGEGVYKDSLTGCQINDCNFGKRYGRLTLQKCMDLSNVGIMVSLDSAFNRNITKYGISLRKTGIMFHDVDDEVDNETNSWQLWSPCDVIGMNSPFTVYQQTAWVNMVGNGGKLLMRFNNSDDMRPIYEIKTESGLKSLREAMHLVVTEGTGKTMDSHLTSTAGIVDVSRPDVINCRSCAAIAFFPYDQLCSNKYTIGVFINKHDFPANRSMAGEVIRHIIDYMVQHNYLARTDEKKEMKEPEITNVKLHPAER